MTCWLILFAGAQSNLPSEYISLETKDIFFCEQASDFSSCKKLSSIEKLRKCCHVAVTKTKLQELPSAFLKCSSYSKNGK